MTDFKNDFNVRIPNRDSDRTYHCLSIYGLDQENLKENWEEIFNIVVDELELKISRIYYEFVSNQSNSHKSVSSLAKLKDKIADDPRGLEYLVCDEMPKDSDPELSRSISIRLRDGELMIAFDTSSQNALVISQGLCKKMLAFEPHYGFLVHGPNSVFVKAWSLGISYEGMSINEERSVHRLSNGHSRLDHCLHDIYRLNLLTLKHLSRSVGSISLGKWIEENRAGSLTNLSHEISIWELDPDSIVKTRAVLSEHGILL